MAAAAALALAVGLGVIGAVQGAPLPGPTVPTPVPGPASLNPDPNQWLQLNYGSHEFTVSGLVQGTVPGDRFSYGDTSVQGLFDEVIVGGDLSDPAYVKDQNWPASVFLAVVDPVTVISGDLSATVEGLTDQFARRLYRRVSNLTVSPIRTDPVITIGNHPAQWAHVDITGTLADGTPERATVAALLVARDVGPWFYYVDLRPEHPRTADYVAAMDAARASIRPIG